MNDSPALQVACTLPFSWSTATDADFLARQHGNRLLLRTLNVIAAALPESERAADRIEARLDLMLHWLDISLHGAVAPLPVHALNLFVDGLAWPGTEALAPAQPVWLKLYPSVDFQAPLYLAALVETPSQAGWLRVRWREHDTDWQEEWTQWLFRQHRRAIQAERG